MKTTPRIIVVLALLCAVAAVLILKDREKQEPSPSHTTPTTEAIPRLVDLGADKCASCKLMVPVLADLKRDFASVFSTEFIDVWDNPGATEKYRIRMIPTQIFFDAAGKELYRHEGFFSRDDILATWKQYGIVPASPIN